MLQYASRKAQLFLAQFIGLFHLQVVFIRRLLEYLSSF